MTADSERPPVGEDSLTESDRGFLREAFVRARRAGEAGERPFSATVVSASGQILAKAINTQRSTGDFSMHAELAALREAVREWGAPEVRGATLYASSEPCAMCSSGAFFAGVSRIVFGTGVHATYRLMPRPGGQLVLRTTSVTEAGDRDVTVVGPALEQEGLSHLREVISHRSEQEGSG